MANINKLLEELRAKRGEQKPLKEPPDLAEEAAGQPSALSALERGARSIKFNEAGKAGLVEEETRGKIVSTPKGDVVVRDDGPAQFVDKPPTAATAVHAMGLAMPFLLPMTTAMGEYMEPGSTMEFAGDVADFLGEAVEVGPEIVAGVATQGASLIPRLAAAGAGAGVGTLARRGISSLLPGEDIGAGETLTTAGVNVGLGALGEGVTTAVAAPFRWFRKFAGKQVIGTDNPAAREAMQGIADEMDIELTPALASLSENAILMETILRRSPGTADAWQKHRVGNLMRASEFVQKWAKGSFGKKISGEKAADRALTAFRSWDGKMRKAQLDMFGEAIDRADALLGGKSVVPYDNFLNTIKEFELDGYDMSGARRGLSRFVADDPAHVAAILGGESITETARRKIPRMTIKQMQKKLADIGNQNIPNLPSNAGTADHVLRKLKNALQDDLNAIADSTDPAFAEAGAALKDARTSYHVMQQPIDEAKTKLVDNILNLEKSQDLEFLPKRIISGGFSDKQLTMLREVLKETDPAAHKQLVRATWDEIAGLGDEAGVGALGAQVAQEAELAGTSAFNPSKIANSIQKNKKQLRALTGESLGKLDKIEKAFRRLAIVNEKMSQSPTALLQEGEKLISVGAKMVTQPGQTFANLAVLGHRKRLTAILTDPNGIDLMSELLDPPKNYTQRQMSTTLQLLGAIVARDAVMFKDQENVNEIP